MTWLDKILNIVSDFLVTLQKLTGVWIWMVTEDVRSEELETILPMQEITDEGTLKTLQRIGFKNRVFVEKKPTGISFVGNSCFICERPWKVKVDIEDAGEAYLCREHLNYAKNNWKNPFKIIKRRQTSNLASYRN
jgi:hypothetical protein